MIGRLGGVLLGLFCLTPLGAQNGYQNVVNSRHATVANGPLGGIVIDVADAANPVERASRLHQRDRRAAGRRTAPPWFELLQKQRLLPADQPPPVLAQTVLLRQSGRLVMPDRARQAGTLGDDANRLTFDFTPPADSGAAAWSDTQRQQIQAFLADLEPVLLRIYGPPAFNNTIKILHDANLGELNMVAYDASSNQVRIELLNDVDSADPTLTPLDNYDLYVLTYAVLLAYRDEALCFYDAWELGMARAAQLLAISEARPDFGFLARDFNLLFTAYDVLNQPGLESPSFVPPPGGGEASVLRQALGTVRAYLAQAAWLKAYAEQPGLFAAFNDAYYARLAGDPTLAGNVPLLKVLMRTVAPTVEGLDFNDWYRRQYVLDTAVIPGGRLYVFNIPQKDFITGEPTNSLPMNVYHYDVDSTNIHRPMTGTVTFNYTAYDGFDLNPAVEGASGQSAVETDIGTAGNEPGIGSAVPLFFNIAGDQQVQMQRIEVDVRVNGMDRRIYFPNDTVASDNQIRNHVYGLVTNGLQGTLDIDIAGKDPIETDVVQGAFAVRVPGGLPVPARATLTFTPDTSGGSQPVTIARNVMFLGPLGASPDVAIGDAVVILETPPETFTTFTQTIPAGLGMVTIPAFAQRTHAAEVLGVPADQLLLARADGAVASQQGFRNGSIYRLWPDTPPFRPGYAYWLQTAQELTVQFDGVEANRDRPFRQHYPPGWAQIGNPYRDLNMLVQNLRVQGVDGSADLSLADAQSQGLVSSGIFAYNRATGGYELVSSGSVLQPFVGYWLNILADRGATIIYPNALGAGRARADSRGRAGDPNRWQLSLSAQSERYADSSTRLGVAPGAAQGYSHLDIAKPPAYGPYVHLAANESGWGGQAGRFAVDLREAGGSDQSWDLLLESNLGAREVTLSWPDLAEVPAQVALVLEDRATGRTRFMRSTGSLVVNLPERGQRELRVTATRRGASSLAITSLQARPTRAGGSVSFGLSAPAEVTVSLCSQSGRLLRHLAVSRAAGRGSNEVAFDARDAQGRPLPRGIYRLDLIAVGADGRQVRTSRLVQVER